MTRKVRTLERRHTPQLPSHTAIVATTASAFEEERKKILAAGCDDIVNKPFHVSEIFNVIQKNLGVRYIYKSFKGSEKQAITDDTEGLTAEALKHLPPELLCSLEQALTASDTEEIERVLEALRPYHIYVAEKLTSMVESFQYEKLQELLLKAKEESQPLQKALASLPVTLLKELEQALVQGDVERIEQSIAAVRPHNAVAAKELNQVAKTFKYQELWTMLQGIRKELE